MRPIQALVFLTAFSLNLLQTLASPQGYCAKSLSPIPSGPRQEQSVVSISSKIYLVAGIHLTATRKETWTPLVEVYDTITDTWSTAAPLPLAAHHTNVAAVDGKLYYLGGLLSKDSIFSSEARPEGWRYDPALNQWEPIAPMPEPRGSAAMGVLGSKIFLAGGLEGGMKPVDTVSSYDTVTNTWTKHPELKLPEARDHAGSAVVDGVFYVVGGRVGFPVQNRATVLALNLTIPGTNWTLKAPMPGARGGLAVAATGKKIYTFGGEGNKASAKGVFGDIAVYDTVSDSWESAAPMAIPRHGFGAASVGNKVYVPGGGAKQGGGEALTVNEVYGPC